MRNLAVLIAAGALVCACNGSHSNSANDRAASKPSGGAGAPSAGPTQQPGSDPTVANRDANGTGTSGAQSNQQVTLVGCLQGPSVSAPARTSGAPDRSSAGSPAATDDMHGSMGQFRLTNATAASNESAGTGANGAGASGGPLVSARSTFVLDGVAADAQRNVNKQVRVTGRLDATGSAMPGSANPASGNTGAANGSAGASGRASVGTSGSGVGSGGSTPGSGSSTGSRSGAAAGNDAAFSNGAVRRLTVESVQVVAQRCGENSRQ